MQVTKELEKPKKIFRAESVRNFFRGSSKNDTPPRNTTILEEDSYNMRFYAMDKALSDGALRNTTKFRDPSESRPKLLEDKKNQLNSAINTLQEQQRVLEYILNNQNILKTTQGASLARETLTKCKKTDISAVEQTNQPAPLNNAKRNLFNENDK